jgi:membrane protein YqaA with SNARE-associated domain
MRNLSPLAWTVVLICTVAVVAGGVVVWWLIHNVQIITNVS